MKNTERLLLIFRGPPSGGSPSDEYVAEDGITDYVAEDGTTNYVQE